MKHFLIPTLALGLLVATTPARADLFGVSVEKQKRLGQDAAAEIERGAPLVTGPVEEWVQQVGARLAKVSDPQFEYTFHVIDSPEINAFCLPGGHIYVYTGLRKVVQNDDELAGILAHEITHAEGQHYARQYKKNTTRGALLGIGSLIIGLPGLAQAAVGAVDFAITQKYSRNDEFAADREGMLRMKKAGYNPQGMIKVLERLTAEEDRDSLDRWLASHPEGKKRVEAAKQLLASTP